MENDVQEIVEKHKEIHSNDKYTLEQGKSYTNVRLQVLRICVATSIGEVEDTFLRFDGLPSTCPCTSPAGPDTSSKGVSNRYDV